MKTIICDLDGTLCNVQHRAAHAERNDYAAFHSALIHDEPFAHIKELLELYHDAGFEIIYLTGRPESWLDATETWLNMHGLNFHSELLMRPCHDDRPDPVFKQAIYCNQLSSKAIAFVLEDRSSVVQMWRSIGVPCLQVDDGNF